MEKNTKLSRTIVCLVLVLIAAVSFFLVSGKAASVETHEARIQAIDNKIETVLKLTATSTLASAGVSAIPGDTATPIAEKLADFTEYFLAILCVLYAEKYLLTILGVGAFKIIIPVACAIFAVGLFWNPLGMKKLGLKLAVFGLALYFTIPISLNVSDMIYDTYKDSIDMTITSAEALTDETSEFAAAEDEGTIKAILKGLSETVGGLNDKAAGILKQFVETLAVLIVTSCVIPILVIVFMIWMTKILLGNSSAAVIPVPGTGRSRRAAD